ncbi:MAG: P-loop NTPase family protein [Clostridia bacterium]
MAKLNLVIADLDERYARGLSDYISSNHSTAFLVSCFTKADSLTMYLKQQLLVDVLLISPDFYDISTEYPNIKLKVVLSTGALSREYPSFQVLNKYNTGERLLGEVVHLYSKLNPSELRLSPYSKNTEFIGVYSTAGGAGKTTVASALSIECNDLGMRSFYLNLESIQSTGMFFTLNGKRNLSYIFYYLKEKSNNLSFLMDGIKCTDADYGVQYFNPPESPLEYEELDLDELEQLILGIKGMGCYDFVFIDMSNAFDTKSLKIMELCDRIILTTLQGPIEMHKNRILHNELVKLNDADRGSVADKFITVINRFKNNNCESFECPIGEAPAIVRIPEYSRALINEGGRLVIDDDGFRKAINQLMKEISGK